MNGLGIVNAQGNYDQGRGADGLGQYVASRYGIGVPESNRPARINGKPTPPASLDPNLLAPRVIGPVGYRASARLAELRKRFPSQARTTFAPVGPIDPNGVEWRNARGPTDAVVVSKVGGPVALVRRPRLRRRPISRAKKIRHRQQFIGWLKNWAPQLYARAKAKADAVEAREAQNNTLGNLGTWWDTFTENIAEVGGAVLQYKTQKAILEAQLERMRAGEPPLQTSEYAPTIAVKPDPGTVREVTGAIGAGFGRMLPFLAIGGVVLVMMMGRGRRRR